MRGLGARYVAHADHRKAPFAGEHAPQRRGGRRLVEVHLDHQQGAGCRIEGADELGPGGDEANLAIGQDGGRIRGRMPLLTAATTRGAGECMA